MSDPVYLQEYRANVMASSFASANVGGACSSTLVTNIPGSRLFGAASDPDVDIVQYTCTKLRNDHTTGSVGGVSLYLENGLQDNLAADVVSAVSTSAADNATRYLRILGVSNNPQPEYLPLNGVTQVQGLRTWSASGVYVVELREQVGSAPAESDPLATAAGPISIMVGTQTLGIIPVGRHTATALIDVGFAATVDDSATIATAASAPAGISFARASATNPITFSPNVAPHEWVTVWARWTLPNDMLPVTDLESAYVIDYDAI